MLAGTLDDLDDVFVGIFGGEIVDAHATGLALPVKGLQALDDLLAGVALLAGGDGILEVEEDMVGLRLGRLLDHLFAGARRGQLDAARAAGRAVAHVKSPQATIFSARRRAISAPPKPSSVR